jgi:uncharacterized protein
MILSHLHAIDVVEVILDDYLRADARALRALETLSRQVPVLFHGVGLGLASAHPVDAVRLERTARLLGRLEPESWSEHIAFVRAGGFEIGHLAAPPRTDAVREGALRNLARIRTATGMAPALENVATLIDPPGSEEAEPAWIGSLAEAGGTDLLLDLHNLYANAINFGRDPFAELAAYPLGRATQVHLSGGEWVAEPSAYAAAPGSRRLLDDHVHDPPAIVYALLAALARTVPQPLTVILERDGGYPPWEELEAQLARARAALAEGRAVPGGVREAAHGRA